jgi:hypothetical protein
MVLTKTTAICLFPAVFYMVWARAGYRVRPALRLAVPPALGGVALWSAYYFLFVRPHYLKDYGYLFSANAYTGIELEPFAKVILNTLGDGSWMGATLYTTFFVVVALMFFWRPRLLTNPLIPALLLWIGGYFVFLAYHNNLQPRYYIVVAVPITVVVALGLVMPGAPCVGRSVLRWPRSWRSPSPSRMRRSRSATCCIRPTTSATPPRRSSRSYSMTIGTRT